MFQNQQVSQCKCCTSGDMAHFSVVGGLDNENPDKQIPGALRIVFKYKLVSLALFKITAACTNYQNDKLSVCVVGGSIFFHAPFCVLL